MATSTPYLGLLKPDGTELVNVGTALNNNFDKVDADALSKNGRLSALESIAGVSSWQPWNPSSVRWHTSNLTRASSNSQYIALGGGIIEAQFFWQNVSVVNTSGSAPTYQALVVNLPFQSIASTVIDAKFSYENSTQRVNLEPLGMSAGLSNAVTMVMTWFDSAASPPQNKPQTSTLGTIPAFTGTNILAGVVRYRTNGVVVP